MPEIFGQSGTPRTVPLSVFGSVGVSVGGSSVIGLVYHDSLSGDGSHHVTTDAQVIYTIAIAPAHGTLLKSGTPMTVGSHFTHQDVHDGLVVYHHDGSANLSDTFRLWCVVSETPGAVSPYVMWVYEHWDLATGPSTEAGFMVGTVLAGTGPGIVPTIDWWGNVFNPGPSQTIPYAAIISAASTSSAGPHTNFPNEGVFVWTYTSEGDGARTSFPSAKSVTSVTWAGLAFTRLYSGSRNTHVWDDIHLWFDFYTYNVELWYAQAPTVIPPGSPLTVQWQAPSGSNPMQVFAQTNMFRNINPSAPWGSNPGAFQTSATGTLPVQTAPVSSVDDQISLPISFSVVTGKEFFTTTSTMSVSAGLELRGGGGGGGFYGGFDAAEWLRTCTCYADVSVYVSGGLSLTDSELLFADTPAFVDLANVANRRLFIAATGTPQWMGANGAIPFAGQVPPVYLTTLGPPLNFTQNNGAGGSLTLSGSIAPADGPGCTDYIVTTAVGPAANPEWRLTVSDDGGRTWSRLVKPREMGKLGEYLTRLRWLKMGQSRERMVKLECTDPVRRNIVGIYIDAGQGMT